MNAHINNDLAHALVLTWEEMGGAPGGDSPERRDYEKVNAILERVESEIKVPLSDALIATVDTAFGTTDDFLALWSIRRAREHGVGAGADHARHHRRRAQRAVRRHRRLRGQSPARPRALTVAHPSRASGFGSRRR